MQHDARYNFMEGTQNFDICVLKTDHSTVMFSYKEVTGKKEKKHVIIKHLITWTLN